MDTYLSKNLGISQQGLKRIAKAFGKDAQEEESSGEMLSMYDEYALDPDMLDTLMSWHGGQGSAIYALGSNLYAGKEVPKEVAESALWELEGVLDQMSEDSEDYDELAELVDMLSYWIKPF